VRFDLVQLLCTMTARTRHRQAATTRVPNEVARVHVSIEAHRSRAALRRRRPQPPRLRPAPARRALSSPLLKAPVKEHENHYRSAHRWARQWWGGACRCRGRIRAGIHFNEAYLRVVHDPAHDSCSCSSGAGGASSWTLFIALHPSNHHCPRCPHPGESLNTMWPVSLWQQPLSSSAFYLVVCTVRSRRAKPRSPRGWLSRT
jgi:hypothetical protein